MSNSKDSKDQAYNLRKKMNVNAEESLDLMTLPPRSEIHKVKDQHKKTKVKLKYPLIRLLALLFILLPIAILAYTIYKNNENTLPLESPSTKNQSVYKEEISISTKNDDQRSLSIPQVDTRVTNEEAPKAEKNLEEYEIILHTVKPEETLYTISQYYYNSRDGEGIIKEWNNLQSNQVTGGQVLKIPLK